MLNKTKIINYKVASVVIFSAVLGACGGSGSGGDGRSAFLNCQSISGGGTSTQQGDNVCLGCTVDNRGRAADGNFSTGASLHTPAGAAGSIYVRATAQEGIMFPGGSTAAAVISTGVLDGSIGIRTLSGGGDQEDRSTTSFTHTMGDRTLVYFETISGFDAVEFELRGSAEAQSLTVFEFCSDADGFEGL